MGALALAALATAAPAHAEVFVAYGEGLTNCRIETVRYSYSGLTTGGENYQSYLGETDCSVPVEQTVHATVAASGGQPGLDGGVCAAVTTRCVSGEEDIYDDNGAPMVLQVSLRAPRGQGWLGAPTNCSGVGTDNLRCEFVVSRSWSPDLIREWIP